MRLLGVFLASWGFQAHTAHPEPVFYLSDHRITLRFCPSSIRKTLAGNPARRQVVSGLPDGLSALLACHVIPAPKRQAFAIFCNYAQASTSLGKTGDGCG